MQAYLVNNHTVVNGSTRAIDPMCERYHWLSPYTYCANNPVNLVDPTGMVWDEPEEAKQLVSNVNNRIERLVKINSEYESALETEITDGDRKIYDFQLCP